MARLWRVHVPTCSGNAGEELLLDRDEAHHVVRVLRLAAGERVEAFDGSGGLWGAEIVAAQKAEVRLRLGAPIECPAEPRRRVVLFQAAGRPEKIDWVVQKATEVGVAAVRLFTAERSAVRAPSEARFERWRRIAVEATKQCRRCRVPVVDRLARVPPTPADGTRALLLDTSAEARPLGGFESAGCEVWLAVGPESGFSADESRAWRDAGWNAVGLGPRVLRTETAGLVAASIVLYGWGDPGS